MKNRIKEIRKSKELTQTAFGEKIGVKGNTITNYENGLRVPSDAVILAICREFGVSEAWLREGVGEMYSETSRDEQIAGFVGRVLSGEDDSFKRRFISMLSKLTDEQWGFIEEKARELFEGK